MRLFVCLFAKLVKHFERILIKFVKDERWPINKW